MPENNYFTKNRFGLEQCHALFLIAPAAIALFGIVIFPLAATFIYSLKNMELISADAGKFVGFSNYLAVLGSSWFWQSLGRTLYFTFVSLTLETILGLLIALLLNGRFFGVGFLRVIFILPWAVPGIAAASLWKWIYNAQYGVLNALLTQCHLIPEYRQWLSEPFLAMNMVIIADVWKMTPLAAIFFLAALQFIDESLYDAAKVDGAGLFRRFFHITLPYLLPAFSSVVVLRTVEKFKAFDLFYVLTGGGPANGTLVLTYEAYLKAFSNLQYSLAATISYLIALLVLAFCLFYVRLTKRHGVRPL